jgi:LysM repeat protein
MKTFKQYLEENRLATLAAAAGMIAGGAMAAPPEQHLPQIDRILSGVGAAEHRGRLRGSVFDFDPNLYIRTGAADKRGDGKPSSAYGPFQFTKSTIEDLSKRHPKIFSGNEEYVSAFIDQGKKMLQNPDDPVYGYGKAGTLATKENHAKYMEMSRAGVDAMAKDLKIDMSKPLSPKDESRLVQRFRGVPLEKSYKKAYDAGVSKAPTTSTQPSKSETPTETPTETPSDVHNVGKGDNLGKIAKKYGKTIEELQKLNPEIKDPNRINIGQKIKTK